MTGYNFMYRDSNPILCVLPESHWGQTSQRSFGHCHHECDRLDQSGRKLLPSLQNSYSKSTVNTWWLLTKWLVQSQDETSVYSSNVHEIKLKVNPNNNNNNYNNNLLFRGLWVKSRNISSSSWHASGELLLILLDWEIHIIKLREENT